MRLIHCRQCGVVVNVETVKRATVLLASVYCDCHGELQKLAVRGENGVFTLSDRARWVHVPDEWLRGEAAPPGAAVGTEPQASADPVPVRERGKSSTRRARAGVAA